MFPFFVLYHLMLSGNFYGSNGMAWNFLGIKYWFIFGVSIFAANRSSLSLKYRSTPPPRERGKRKANPLKGLRRAVCYLFKKLKRVFA